MDYIYRNKILFQNMIFIWVSLLIALCVWISGIPHALFLCESSMSVRNQKQYIWFGVGAFVFLISIILGLKNIRSRKKEKASLSNTSTSVDTYTN